MASINKVILMGNLGSDPDFKTTSQWDIPVCHFSIATNETFKDKKTDKDKTITEWHRIVAWGKLAEYCYEELGKGDSVLIEGRLTTHSWTDKESGQKRYMTEVNANKIDLLSS